MTVLEISAVIPAYNEQDAIALIKFKELYGRMESAMDKCEDVANIIETIVVKNG